MKRFALIFILMLSVFLYADELGSSLISFDMNISDEKFFGISSVPVSSWDDETESAESVAIPPDGEEEVYVYWKVFSAEPLTLTLSGVEMTGDSGRVEWAASWDIEGEEKILDIEDGYSPEIVYQYGGGRLRSAGSREVTLEARVIDPVPGIYQGKMTVEIASE